MEIEFLSRGNLANAVWHQGEPDNEQLVGFFGNLHKHVFGTRFIFKGLKEPFVVLLMQAGVLLILPFFFGLCGLFLAKLEAGDYEVDEVIVWIIDEVKMAQE